MNVRVILAVAIAIVSVLAGSATQLDTLVGPGGAKLIVAACNLGTAVMAAVMGVLSTQSNQNARIVDDPGRLMEIIKAMPGVTNLSVNANASPKLAQLAMASDNNKIEPDKGAEQAVRQVANSAPVV